MPKLRRINVNSFDGVNRFIIDNCEAINKLITDKILGRQRISAVLSTSEIALTHTLGRVPQSIVPVLLNASATVWQSTPPTDKQIFLKASTAVTVTIEVY